MEDNVTLTVLMGAAIGLARALEVMVKAITNKIKAASGKEEHVLKKADIEDISKALAKVEEDYNKECEILKEKIIEIRDILNNLSKDETHNARMTEKAIDKIATILESMQLQQSIFQDRINRENS